MSIQDTSSEPTSVKVLHAGSLTTLVRQGLGLALHQANGIALKSENGHSIALAMAIKEQRTSGDVYLSADAGVNQILLGPTNGDWIRWFVVFARNSIVLAYSPKSRFIHHCNWSNFCSRRQAKSSCRLHTFSRVRLWLAETLRLCPAKYNHSFRESTCTQADGTQSM